MRGVIKTWLSVVVLGSVFGAVGVSPVLGLSCYDSVQSRVHASVADPWVANLTMKAGQDVKIGCMHDGWGQMADQVVITIIKSGVVIKTVNGSAIDPWTIPDVGIYDIKCADCDGTFDIARLTVTESAVTPTATNCPVCASGPSKGSGNANCDDTVDWQDFSVWRREYYDDGNKGAIEKDDWLANFGCPGDKVTDLGDFNTWINSCFGEGGGCK